MKKIFLTLVLVSISLGPSMGAFGTDLQGRISGYSQQQTALNSKQKSAVQKFVSGKVIDSITCIGLTKPKPSVSETRIAQERARLACAWAREATGLKAPKTQIATAVRERDFGGIELRLKTQAPQVPTSTAPSSPKPRPSSPFYNYRITDTGVLERRGSLESLWYSDSASTLELSEVRTKAFSVIKAAKSGAEPARVSWVIGENVPKDMAAAYRSQLNEAIQYFRFTGMQTPIEILIVTELDRETLRQFWSKNFNGAQIASRYERGLDQFSTNQVFRSVSGGAESRTNRETLLTSVGITFMMGSQHNQESNLLIEHVAHELTHTWQFFAFGQTTQDPTKPGPNVTQLVPCHLTEGGANLLGAAIASPFSDWYSEATNVIVRRVVRDLGSAPASRQDIVALMQRSENWSDCQAGYGIGHLAYEWLVAEYGLQKYLALHTEIIRLSSFDLALQSIYGFGKADFYERSSTYILDSIKKVL